MKFKAVQINQSKKPVAASSDIAEKKSKLPASDAGIKKTEAATTSQTTAFTRALAAEIVKNLTSIGQFTTRPFRRTEKSNKPKMPSYGEFPILVDTSVLIDGRIVPVVNSGFFSGTFLIPKFVLAEVQHIADSADPVRRAKGRRGLDVAMKLKSQKANQRVKTKVIGEDEASEKEVDHKLVLMAKKNVMHLITLDFNLAQLARAQGVKVLSINDLSQAMKIALVPGEECDVRISHEGKERDQGVGYLDDGTMVIVESAKDKAGQVVRVVIQKLHQTPAGQLFFARLV